MVEEEKEEYCYIDFDRLKNPIHQFQCPICLNLVLDPKECIDCGALFGKKCLGDWQSKHK